MSTVQEIAMEDKCNESSMLKKGNQLEKTSSVIQQASKTNVVQKAKLNPNSLSYENIMQLQSTIGNRAVTQLLKNLVNDGLETKAEAVGGQNSQMKISNATISKKNCVQLAKIKKKDKPKGKPRASKRPIKCSTSERTKYRRGTHGFRKSEQKMRKTSGRTHQSEHAVGFAVINKTSGESRGVGKRARDLENDAPAYQEVLGLHRDHIGTGTSTKTDASGFNSQSYRDAQRSLIEEGDVSSAVQLNQLAYAFDPNFRGSSEGLKAADDSFGVMVEYMEGVEYAKKAEDRKVSVSPEQKAEMSLSRVVARTGIWPTAREIDEAKKKFGVAPKSSGGDVDM